MSLISDVLAFRGERKVLDASALTWEVLGGRSSRAGITVDVRRALQVAAVFACIRVLGEDLAKLPFKLYRESSDGRKVPEPKHPLYWLLYRRPNDWMTAFEFREALMWHAALLKGGYAFINQSSDGRPLELLPLVPSSVTIRQLLPSRELVFEVRDLNGIVGTFPRSRILHIHGPSWNTISGMELLDQAREVIGLSAAIEESQARLYANGARPSGILSTDKTLTPEARARLKALFSEGYQAVMNTGKVPILDDGLKFLASAMTSVDAQTLESRRLEVEEVCRMFRVYPQKVMHADKTATYASVEQFNIAHGTDTIQPWVERWEQAVCRDLLTQEELRSGLVPKMSMQGLMRGDNASRAAYYKSALGTASSPGWLSPNDVRRLEDQDPDPDPSAEKIVTVDRLTGKPPQGSSGGDPPPVE